MAERIDLGPMGCIRCGEPGRLYAFDLRTGGWLRYECRDGHWADLAPESIYIPEAIRTKLMKMNLLIPKGSVGP